MQPSNPEGYCCKRHNLTHQCTKTQCRILSCKPIHNYFNTANNTCFIRFRTHSNEPRRTIITCSKSVTEHLTTIYIFLILETSESCQKLNQYATKCTFTDCRQFVREFAWTGSRKCNLNCNYTMYIQYTNQQQTGTDHITLYTFTEGKLPARCTETKHSSYSLLNFQISILLVPSEQSLSTPKRSIHKRPFGIYTKDILNCVITQLRQQLPTKCTSVYT